MNNAHDSRKLILLCSMPNQVTKMLDERLSSGSLSNHDASSPTPRSTFYADSLTHLTHSRFHVKESKWMLHFDGTKYWYLNLSAPIHFPILDYRSSKPRTFLEVVLFLLPQSPFLSCQSLSSPSSILLDRQPAAFLAVRHLISPTNTQSHRLFIPTSCREEV